jgi:sporulation protein YlmC with PRC-barrel domain
VSRQSKKEKAMVSTTVETQPVVLTASSLKGCAVKNHHGDELGKVEELMVDLTTGRVGYCVISFGGVLGIGNKLYAVPFKAMKLNVADRIFRLEITKAKLAEAPGFDKDTWPDMVDTTWGTRLHGFYGVEPEPKG